MARYPNFHDPCRIYGSRSTQQTSRPCNEPAPGGIMRVTMAVLYLRAPKTTGISLSFSITTEDHVLWVKVPWLTSQ